MKKSSETAKVQQKTVDETRAKVDKLFKQCKDHAAKQILDTPVDKNHPKYEEHKNYQPLSLIEVKFMTNKYQTVTEVKNDLLEMVSTQMQI